MGSKMKLLVALGALLGLIGVFLPLAQATGSIGKSAISLGLSLWASAAMGLGLFAYGVLGAFVLALLFAVLGIMKGFGRGFAAGSLAASLGPLGLGVIWISETLARGATGVGLWLIVVGGLLAFVGSVVTLVKPERAAAPATPAREAIAA